MSKRLLSVCLAAILAFSMFGAAFAAENSPIGNEASYYIAVNHKFVTGQNEGALKGFSISGATVVAHTDKTTGGTEVENKRYLNREYNIVLGRDTPASVVLSLMCDVELGGANTPTINDANNTAPAAIKANWEAIKNNGYIVPLTLTEGKGSVTLYVAPSANLANATLHTFNFEVEEADISNDPEPEEVASIAIDTPPFKTTYFEGESFYPAGMVVLATLKDDSIVPVAGYSFSPNVPLSLGDTKVTVSFGEYNAEQEIEVLPGAIINDVQVVNGQMLMDLNYLGYGMYEKKNNQYDAVILHGEDKGRITIQVSEVAEVRVNDVPQAVTDGICELSLDTSVKGTSTIVEVSAGEDTSEYAFTCYSQASSGLPTAVLEYFCVASQYTNGAGLGPYGLNPVRTLRGYDMGRATGGMELGPLSLGNFGGYVTYYFEDPIVDGTDNRYGIDFVVWGNSHDGSDQFAEPGNVLVSEDGKTWYTLAGSLHYDDCALWNYSITYKNHNYMHTTWTDSNGNSGTGDRYPEPSMYPDFPWTPEMETEITLTGTAFDPQSGANEYGNTLPQYPHFGYADSGTKYGEGELDSSPYAGIVYRGSRWYTDRPDGFDLKWAVDEQGLPVTFANGVKYIKIQASSNIGSGGGGIGEKSPEINGVTKGGISGGDKTVGLSTAPSSITVDGKPVELQDGVYVYEDVPVSGPFIVNVEAAEGANIYINGSRGSSATLAKMPNHKMLRIIVQDDVNEPQIYYLALTETSGGENDKYTVVTFDPAGGTMASAKERTYLPEMPDDDKVFPIPQWTDRTFLGWYDADGNKYELYSEDMPTELTLNAKWKYNLEPGESPTLRVSFRLIGATKSQVVGEEGKADSDIDLGKPEGYKGSEYKTWIATRSYTMNKGDTMYDLFIKATTGAGLASKGAENNYVSAITAPSSHGGYELAEFTNGLRSGWMYTVGNTGAKEDQKHPSRGLLQYDLRDGDVVIWHYVNDYAYEVEDWFDDSEYPSQATDDTFYSRWLEAPDVTPTVDNAPKTGDNQQAGAVTLTPKATAINGTAAASVSASDMSSAISAAKKNSSTAIIIEPEISGTAKKVMAELPKSSLSDMAKDTDADLRVATSIGSVTLSNNVLSFIASEATGSTVTVSLEAVDTKALTAEQQKTVGEDKVYDISILSGGKPISSFDGKAITIALPYTLKSGEKAEGVTVWYLSDSGTLERMTGKYDTATKLVTFTTKHLSKYVVGYEAPWNNPFADVKTTDWYYDAVKYAVRQELFNGTSDTAFSPNADMTRAMLVTVLHRLDGKPAVTAANSFTDVQSGQWYTDAVLWANDKKIVEGYGNGVFGTNDNITREQLAAILYRYAQLKGYDVTKTTALTQYTDAVTVSGWSSTAMKWAVSEGLISGTTDTTLAPTASASRAQVATILMRFAENVAK